jgi:hypothetical protein
MAGVTISRVSMKDIESGNIFNKYELSTALLNVSGGLNASKYSFRNGVGYSMRECVIGGKLREVWYVYDDTDTKVTARSFFMHDKEGNNFSGVPRGIDNMLSLVTFLAGKTFIKTERFDFEYGPLYKNGVLVERNAQLERRYYYDIV